MPAVYNTGLDFLKVKASSKIIKIYDNGFEEKKRITTFSPSFQAICSKDLMIKGGKFYAIWDNDANVWSTDMYRAQDIIDAEIYKVMGKHGNESSVAATLRDCDSGQVSKWRNFCEKLLVENSFTPLDQKILFADHEIVREDLATFKLSYSPEDIPTPAYDQLTSTNYNPEELHKLEWSVGAILTNDIKSLQKMPVLYGSGGTGKSTYLNIVQDLLGGDERAKHKYWVPFMASELGGSGAFKLSAFKDAPVVAIQHDGDLSKIEDNTTLNSLISHEAMLVNEKNKAPYAMSFNTFLFMGTNTEVKITDSKSGLLRRVIDISPSGRKVPTREYNKLVKKVKYELSGIAYHCMQVYKDDPRYYDNYVPLRMMQASNDLFNFLEENFGKYSRSEYVQIKDAWADFKLYCEGANVKKSIPYRKFKQELPAYFKEVKDVIRIEGKQYRNILIGFKEEMFEYKYVPTAKAPAVDDIDRWIVLKDIPSLFDELAKDFPAQLANEKGGPRKYWDDCKTQLKDIDTSKLHYVRVPINHIVIDLDIPNPGTGTKDLQLNIEKVYEIGLPKTYAEVSKSGQGLHLHYIYSGDPEQLKPVIEPHVEVKVYTGKMSLRRLKTLCNDIPITTIASGLPLKEVSKKLVNKNIINNEEHLKNLIKKALRKEGNLGGTKCFVEWIDECLNTAYKSGQYYNVEDMRGDISTFASLSSNNKEYCMKLVENMKFKSECDPPEIYIPGGKRKRAFFDIEVYPNLVLVCYKEEGDDKPIIDLINPTLEALEQMFLYDLIGFNCRRYDNHIIYARCEGYDNSECYNLSRRIIDGDKTAFMPGAYALSYTDIFDFASAANKMSLKKHEIRLGIKHQEMDIPWDQPVPEELIPKVIDYCHNDVLATEAVFNDLASDFGARKILSELAGMTCNDTTNTLTTRIIFGSNRNPQSEFQYRDLSRPITYLDPEVRSFLENACPEMMAVTHTEDSLLPCFPGYRYDKGKSTYRGENVGEGGFVKATTGFHGNVALLDVASMHPHSIIAECLFGPRYSQRFKDIVDGRIIIKHKDWEHINDILDGALEPYVSKIESGEISSKDLATALKTAINSVYGLTDTSFTNPFRDPRNIDNIVAKRGALFMIDLMFEVQDRGFTVAHIKTDSIKIPDATPEIIQFVYEFGLKYGYKFEHEATYEKMCLVNNTVYIAKYLDKEMCEKMYGYIPEKNDEHPGEWTATGAQFRVSYVFKTLFSGEPIGFNDMCETKSVKTDIYIDFNEQLPDVSKLEKELVRMKKDPESDKAEMDALETEIEKGHNYHFIGKVGLFCPIKEGCGGGRLMRETPGLLNPYASVTGTKEYRWKEAVIVEQNGLIDQIDTKYYDDLVNEALEAIAEYCDPEWFRFGRYYGTPEDEPYITRK